LVALEGTYVRCHLHQRRDTTATLANVFDRASRASMNCTLAIPAIAPSGCALSQLIGVADGSTVIPDQAADDVVLRFSVAYV